MEWLGDCFIIPGMNDYGWEKENEEKQKYFEVKI